MRRRSASNLAERFVFIDEVGFVAENVQEGAGMSMEAKRADTPRSASPLRFLITTIGGRYLAFDAESVQEVLTFEKRGSLQDPVAEGIVYPLVNLAVRLGRSVDGSRDTTNVVLLIEGTSRGSVRAEKVHGLLEIPQIQLLPLPTQFRGPEQRWYRGMILFERSVALVLNTTWVLEEQVLGVGHEARQGRTEPSVSIEGVAGSKNI